MKNWVAIKWARNPMAATLLLLAFCARALIPTGFMPGPGGLVFCPGDTPMQGSAIHAMLPDMSTMDMSSMDMSGMPVDSSQDSRQGGSSDHESSSLCPFAAAACTMASTHIVGFSAPAVAESEPIQLLLHSFVPRGTIVPSLLPRGPPSFS